jgi:hypothetical protein
MAMLAFFGAPNPLSTNKFKGGIIKLFIRSDQDKHSVWVWVIAMFLASFVGVNLT